MRRRALLFLTVMMAVLVVTGGTALAVTYTTSTSKALKLNKASFVGTALTKLASNAVGAALTLETDSTDPNATPLSLQTETSSQAPMQVNSQQKVANLNADKVDGIDTTSDGKFPASAMPGVTGYELVEVDTSSNSTDLKFTSAVCPTGKVAVGGSVGAISAAGQVIPYRNEADPADATRWYGEAREIPPGTSDDWFLRVQAVCVDAAP
jgi:hypothetical protein